MGFRSGDEGGHNSFGQNPVMFLLHHSWTQLAVWDVALSFCRIIPLSPNVALIQGTNCSSTSSDTHSDSPWPPLQLRWGWKLLSGGNYPVPYNNRSRFLSPKHRLVIQGDITLIYTKRQFLNPWNIFNNVSHLSYFPFRFFFKVFIVNWNILENQHKGFWPAV